MAKKKRSLATRPTESTTIVGLDAHAIAIQQLRNQTTQIITEVLPKIIREYATDQSIPYDSRLTTIVGLLGEILACAADTPLRKTPDSAPTLYKERNKREHPTPIIFFRAFYSDFADITLSDIRKLDFDLYRALHNWKQKYGWPADFVLHTRPESNELLLSTYTGTKLTEESIAKATATLKRVAQLYEAARYRARKTHSSE
jgi:hypothetical protein